MASRAPAHRTAALARSFNEEDSWERGSGTRRAPLAARRPAARAASPISIKTSWSAAARRAADEADIERRDDYIRRVRDRIRNAGCGTRDAGRYRAQKPPDTTTTGRVSFGLMRDTV